MFAKVGCLLLLLKGASIHAAPLSDVAVAMKYDSQAGMVVKVERPDQAGVADTAVTKPRKKQYKVHGGRKRQEKIDRYVEKHHHLPLSYYPNRHIFSDEPISEAQKQEYEVVDRDTWKEFKNKYRVNTKLMKTLLDGPRFKHRAAAYAEKTRGLLADEIHRAQMFGFCQGVPMNSLCNKELGYCLEVYLPVAYFAHLHGCLGVSGGYSGTEAFYFFNPDHRIMDPSHHPVDFTWKDFEPTHPMFREYLRDRENGLNPRGPARTSRLPSYGLTWPPIKDFYHNKFLKGLGKRIAIVGGKHTTEWSGPPLNTFAEPAHLKPIIDTLLEFNYTVVYKRPGEKIGVDSKFQEVADDPGDYDFVRAAYQGQDVILWQDLEADLLPLGTIEPEIVRKNVLMLSIYANSDLFVMTQGGNSVLASLFDGEVFIYHAAGGECLEHNIPPFTDQYVYDRWSHHGGARMTVVNYHADLERNLKAFLQQKEFARLEFH